MATPGSNAHIDLGTMQLREGQSLAGQKVNYLDSGYSEEDGTGVMGGQGGVPVGGQEVTSCLMKTASGSIYIPGSE